MKTKIFFPILLIIAFFGQSCNEFLEEELVSDVSSGTYYTTPAGLEDAVKAAYAEMKPFFGVERGFTMTAFGTDIHTNGADGSHKAINFYDGGLNPRQSQIRDTWNDFYRGVNQCNAVINRSEAIDMDPALKEQRIAEVRFLRGFYYFILTRTFGDIHLSLEETEGVEIIANKTPASEIYAQAIIPDLEFAISKLPDEQSDYGRATKPAAEFLLGQALLTRSYTSFAAGDDATKAATLFGNVINNYGFALLDDFNELWNIDNEENAEIIFTVQNSKGQVDEGLDGNGNRGHLYFLMEYDKLPGMTRDIENGRPWKRFRPTEFTLTLWDRDVDSRYDNSYKHVWYANSEGNIPNWTQEEADAGHVEASKVGQPKFTVGDTAVFIPGPQRDAEWDADAQAKARYMVITNDEYTQKLYPTLKKFLDNTRPNRQHTQGQRDFILMRLADAYLLRAEAYLKAGDVTKAAADINVVRERAAWDGKEADMMIAPADVTLDFILDERARELAGEGQRWWDLTRTKKLVERVRLHNPDARDNIQEYHMVRPIPQDQIDRTQNEDGPYGQNPGYEQ
ncbi:RagB/SusD family nutrient uptake outer membrane protein [Flammeovirgaceae bacterium SG7u.111]|nr:RagB/SusD family nutrient uptake outer membrane protein [Flammeovirgaceae bacterium SG7u.132]WPO36904.1 RagB/SusD family nutrient uptake outer membrane protein [Flammeovirgaceae bacterium SG7u.111]